MLADGLAKRRAGDLRGAGHLTGEVVGNRLGGHSLLNSLADQLRGLLPADVLEHESAGKNDGAGVGLVLAGVLGSRAMRGFKDSVAFADVRARSHAEAAHFGSEGIRHVVAVQVRQGQNAVFGRTEQDLLEHGVGDAILDDDLAFGSLAAEILGHFLLGDGDIAELVDYCNKNVKNVNVELPVEKYLKGINRKCLCGTTSLYVNWYGDVYPCAFTEGKLKLGNIREKKVGMILNEINNFTHDNEFCYKCPINRYKDYEKLTKEVIQ